MKQLRSHTGKALMTVGMLFLTLPLMLLPVSSNDSTEAVGHTLPVGELKIADRVLTRTMFTSSTPIPANAFVDGHPSSVAEQEMLIAARIKATTPKRVSRSVPVRTPTARTTSTPPTVDHGTDVWSALAKCESGGDPNAVSSNRLYWGAFQFAIGTWHGIGMSGVPTDYDYGTQLAAAKKLQSRSGWGQWPRCARRLGLI
jgi:hypothetical protein